MNRERAIQIAAYEILCAKTNAMHYLVMAHTYSSEDDLRTAVYSIQRTLDAARQALEESK